MSLSKVHGRFGVSGGQIQWNETDITKSTVNVTIDVASIDTGVSARDTDLKSSGMSTVNRSLNAMRIAGIKPSPQDQTDCRTETQAQPGCSLRKNAGREVRRREVGTYSRRV